jgi:hypothetical protein
VIERAVLMSSNSGSAGRDSEIRSNPTVRTPGHVLSQRQIVVLGVPGQMLSASSGNVTQGRQGRQEEMVRAFFELMATSSQ